MQILRSLLLPAIFAAVCSLPVRATAQDATPPSAAESESRADADAATSELLPGGTGPAATTGTHTGGGHHNGNGGRRRSGRHHEQLVNLADADPLEVRVSYRRAKTVAMAQDPGLAELLHRADAARTDPERRAFLKEYYSRLYASVCRIDPSEPMKAHVKLLVGVAAQRYDPKRREVGGDEDLVNGSGRGRRGRVQ